MKISFVRNEFVKSIKVLCIVTVLLLFLLAVYCMSTLFLPGKTRTVSDWKERLMKIAEQVTLDNYETTGVKDTSVFVMCKDIVDKNDWMTFLEMMCDDETLPPAERKIYEYCIKNKIEPSENNPEYSLLVRLTQDEANGDNVDKLKYILENCPQKYNENQSKEVLYIIMLTLPTLLFFSFTADLLLCDVRNGGISIIKRAPTSCRVIKDAKFMTLFAYNVLFFVIAFFLILAILSYSYKDIFNSYFTFGFFGSFITIRFRGLYLFIVFILFLLKTAADYLCCTIFEVLCVKVR